MSIKFRKKGGGQMIDFCHPPFLTFFLPERSRGQVGESKKIVINYRLSVLKMTAQITRTEDDEK